MNTWTLTRRRSGRGAGADDVAAVLDGTRVCTAHEHDVLAQALNDFFTERGADHPVRYSGDLADGS